MVPSLWTVIQVWFRLPALFALGVPRLLTIFGSTWCIPCRIIPMSHILMCHVYHMNTSCRTYEYVMSHMWMRHVAHVNMLCLAYKRVLSHIWMSHVALMNESCRTHAWVTSHIYIPLHATQRKRVTNQQTHMDESCSTYEWVMSHIWMSLVARMNEACHTCECGVSHIPHCMHNQYRTEKRHEPLSISLTMYRRQMCRIP